MIWAISVNIPINTWKGELQKSNFLKHRILCTYLLHHLTNSIIYILYIKIFQMGDPWVSFERSVYAFL